MFTFHNHLIDRITLNLNHGFVVLLNIMEKPKIQNIHTFFVNGQNNTLCVLIDLIESVLICLSQHYKKYVLNHTNNQNIS